MAVKNIECQLAQGQIGRYLAGIDMSTEAVAQLEFHIAECEDCSSFVEDKKKSLKELAGKGTAAAYVADPEPQPEPVPTPEPARTTPTQALIQILKERTPLTEGSVVIETNREPAGAKSMKWKAFAYSGGLGLVLLAMSHFTSNPTALFGDKAAEPVAAAQPQPEPKPETPAKPSGDPFSQEPPKTVAASETTSAATTTEKPADPSTELPNSPTSKQLENKPATNAENVSRPAAKPTPISKPSTPPAPRIRVKSRRIRTRPQRIVRRPARPAVRRGNSIRVYDENGRPISGA